MNRLMGYPEYRQEKKPIIKPETKEKIKKAGKSILDGLMTTGDYLADIGRKLNKDVEEGKGMFK